MGEAKRRLMNEASFGSYPKDGYGIVISSPVRVEGSSAYLESSDLDPLELRRSLLFWDKIIWPADRGIFIAGSEAEVGYLSDLGIMTRPFMPPRDGDVAQNLAIGYVDTFKALDRSEPGRWSLSEGPQSFLFKDKGENQNNSMLIDITQAVPVPGEDVPLEDIVIFKDKRRDEVRLLVIALNQYAEEMRSANDSSEKILYAQQFVQTRCVDLIRVARESKIKMRVSDMQLNFEIDPAKSFVGGAGASVLANQFGMTQVMALLGVAAASIKIKTGLSFSFNREQSHSRRQLTNGPFRVVSRYLDRPI